MMKVKFANGVVKECTAPMEQKIFKTLEGKTVGTGWVLVLRLTGNITSTELDGALTPDSSSTLEFLTTNDKGEDTALFTLEGYNTVTSSTIRHAEDPKAAYTEIQMSKGV